MSVIVTDRGFGPDTFESRFVPLDVAGDGEVALHLEPETEPARLQEIANRALAIRIAFHSFADGRGFTLAARLRQLGYRGRLRAQGHVLSDQFAMARRAGFDEVEISEELAARQPETEWLMRAEWRAHNYQARLRDHRSDGLEPSGPIPSLDATRLQEALRRSGAKPETGRGEAPANE